MNYTVKLRAAMDSHYDNEKVDQIADQLKNTTISDSSQENSDFACDDRTLEKIPATKA